MDLDWFREHAEALTFKYERVNSNETKKKKLKTYVNTQ